MDNIKQKKLDFKFTYFLMTALLSFSISASVLETLQFGFPFFYILVFILSVVSSLFFFVVFYKFKAGVVIMGIIATAFTGLTLMTYYASDSLSSAFPVGNSIEWFVQYLFFQEPFPSNGEPYVLVITCLIVVITALFLYFIIYRKELLYVTIIITIAAYYYQLNSNFTRGIKWSDDFNFSFYLGIFLLILFYFLHSYKKRKEEKDDGYTKPAKYLRLTILVSSLIFLLIIVLPKPDASVPISEWLDQQVFRIRGDIENFFMRTISFNITDFNLSSTGYSEDSKQLGGPVRGDDKVTLKVKTDKDIYLRGTVKENYTGHVWRILERKDYEFDDSSNPVNIDLSEKDFSKTLVKSKKLNPDDMWEKYNINIDYKGIVTKSIFTPLKESNIIFIQPDQYNPKVNVNSTVESDKTCPFTFQYDVTGYNINYNFPETLDILRKSHKGLYNSYKAPPAGISAEDFDTLKQNAEKNYTKYTQIPPTMPARVMELAQQITVNDKSDFDKVKAIESYLAINTKYTTKPSVVPINRDFVDYFLFDKKEGYCTYYASAMVMMVRSLGIPARYVEGFRVDATEPGEECTDVLNNDGHAWVEVYFEGIGWINFEPTTVFYQTFYGPVKDDIKNQFLVNPADSMNNNAPLSPMQKPISDVKDVNEATPEPVTPSPGPATTVKRVPSNPNPSPSGVGRSYGNQTLPPSPPEDKSGNPGGLILTILLIIAVIGAAGAWIAYNFTRINRLLSKASSLDNNEAVILMFRHYFKAFKSLGYNFQDNDTPLEFKIRLKNESTFEKLPLDNVFDIFLQARYGNTSVSDKDKEEVLGFINNISEAAKSSLGPVTFYFYRIILGQV